MGKRLLEKELQILKRKSEVAFAEVHYECSLATPFYYKFGF
ncbi:MAG: hypothetical protein ACP5JW_00900 [Candidatus Bathyarchaeia archaeon]